MTRSSACNSGLSSLQSNKVCSSTNCRYEFKKTLRIVLFNLNARNSNWEKVVGNYAILRAFENRSIPRFFQGNRPWIRKFNLFTKNRRVVLKKWRLVSSQTSRRSSDFKGHFSNSFPCNIENIRRNFIFVGENRLKVRVSQKKVRELCKICWTNDFEFRLETLFSS